MTKKILICRSKSNTNKQYGVIKWTPTNKHLDNLVTLESGSRPKGGVAKYTDGIPSIGAEHLNNSGGFNYDKIKYVPTQFYERMNKGRIMNNDILLVKDGATIGKVSLVSNYFPFKHACVNEHVYILRSRNSDIINQDYIFYYLRTPYAQDKIRGSVSGTAQGGLPRKFMEDLVVPVPSYKEQRRIVARIESIFAEIDSEVTNTARVAKTAPFSTLFQEIRRSTLTHMFMKLGNTNNKSVGDVCCVLQSSSLKKTRTDNKPSVHVGLEHIISHANKLMGHGNPDDFKTSRAFLKNNVLYGRLRPELNKVWLATREGQCSTDILPLVVNTKRVLPKFLLYALSTQQFMSYAVSRSSGTKMPRVRWKEIKIFQIPVPTIQKQQHTVAKIESIFSKIDAEKAKIKELQARAKTLDETVAQIKKSVLHLAFSGRLLPGKPEEHKQARRDLG